MIDVNDIMPSLSKFDDCAHITFIANVMYGSIIVKDLKKHGKRDTETIINTQNTQDIHI